MTVLNDGTITVSLDVNWDLLRNSELIINRARTIGGKSADYLWTNFKRFELPIENIPSSDTAVINDWWQKTTALKFNFDSNSYDVYIVSESQPFQQLSKPYWAEWQGVINLEVI